ncbi:hypothetical protein LEP1GSC043_1347 [Leptospira weilii str. Ecochallenge]|uniref:Uncharacterized protein n=1 Tax=Leptospira weilii str. Ecochallenge TaxID=1049986 RepID=N1U6D5_9LEPT|nr:hypothetical protein LEP1GSC086_2197 [Leptospira weilii str. LNT 1234]EMY13721.1 hypothetical protein LEP1GSC043_1347 [Leptospira weilii str. Ecochallenge]
MRELLLTSMQNLPELHNHILFDDSINFKQALSEFSWSFEVLEQNPYLSFEYSIYIQIF